MPVARFQMPDGRIARFEVPEGTTPEQAQSLITQSLAPQKPQESAATIEGRDAPGALRGLVSGLQGPTMGFADEILGALGAAGKTLVNGQSFGDNYRKMRDFYRGASKQEEEDNPVLSRVFRGAAAAPLATIGPAPVAGAKMLVNAGRAGASGAISGGIQGVGDSTADTLGGMLKDGAQGAALGGALGAAAVPVARGMGGMYDVGKSLVFKSAAEKLAQQKLAEALLRDARGAAVSGNPAAVIGQAESRLTKMGPEARVADASGQNTRQLLDTLATLPGTTKDAAERAILERQAGRADRLRGSAQSALGQDGTRLATSIDDLLAKRSEAAAPLYDALYKRGVFINDELRGVIDAANRLGAGGEAKRIAIAKQRDYSLTPDTQWAGMRDLDYLKQGLDDIIAANKNEFGKLTKVGAAVQGLKTDLVDILDQETKGMYRQAREAFAGPSALIDAAKEGRMVWSRDDTAITKALEGLTSGEKDAFRLGAFEALRAKLGNMAGQNEILRMWRDKTTSEKLRAIFGDERSFREFASTVAAETRMKGLESVGRGSQTAARQYGAGDLDAAAVADVVKTAANPISVASLVNSAGNLWNKVKTPEPVRNRMGDILLSQGPRGSIELQALEQELRRVAAERAVSSGLLGVSSGQLSTPIGGLLSPR